MEIAYRRERELAPADFIAVLKASGLAERRPVDDARRIEAMLAHANVIVTAREDERIVGVARGLSDFGFCFYLSDLAVDRACQGQGIGRRLIEEAHAAAGRETTLILLAAPGATTYYPHIGLQPHESCWIVPRRT